MSFIMKKYLLLLQLFFLYSISFSQSTNSCQVPNAGFESGNLTGWTAKSGYYGANVPCPTGTCPRFKTVYTGGAVTSGTMNAGLGNAGDRHTIMSAAGGNDPNATNPAVPVVAPGGGNYSFRLGNGNTGSVNGTFSEAEAVRLTFPVTNQNASFTYRYAFFVANPGHLFAEQPSFEVVVLDQKDSIIPCGRYFVVAGNSPAGCVNSAGFVNGNNGFVYKPWTDVGLDLTGYIGQNISIEFRTTDCFPDGGSTSTTTSNGIVTYCVNGNCCTYPVGGTPCVPAGAGCSGNAGTHSAYAYIDAYCAPLDVQAPVFCAGAASIQICAPAGYASYLWPAGQPGLNGSPTTQCVTINNPVAGATYTVNMVSATGCPTKTTVTLKGSNPQVNSSTICAGTSATLTASGGNGNYVWNTGATTSSIVVSPTVTTTYTVTTASTGTLNCPGVATSTVTVGGLTPNISPPATICAGEMVTLTASGGTAYVWAPGGGTTSSISVTPTATTTYSVVVSNGGCFGSISQTITVNNNIQASINTPPAVCIGSSVTLTASGGNSYTWNTGALTPVIVVSPTANTTYSVVVSVGTGCIDSASVNVVVNPLPVPTISPNTTVCAGSPTSFTAGGGISYLWSTGSVQNPLVVTPSASTTYSVVVTDANGCTNAIAASVVLNPIPVPTITGASPICAGNSSTLTASGGQTYTWNTGETTASIAVTPAATSVYTVTAFADGCTNYTSFTVTVVPPPSAVFTNLSPCEGTAVTFSDGSLSAQGDPISQWIWTMPGGSPANATNQNPASTYSTAGTYTATLIVISQAGCKDTVTQKVIIYANPIALFKGGNAACASLCHTFIDSSQAVNGNIATWAWTFPGGSPASSNLQNPTICYNTPGTYGASLIVKTNYGCEDNFSLNPVISVYPVPVADFCVAPATAPSTDPTFNFCDLWSGNVVQWFWDFGDNTFDSIHTDPVHSYSASVSTNDFYDYNVCLNVKTRYGCWDTICKKVELIPEFTFYIPNTFTPNADGTNELFFGKGRGIKEYNIWVFDRWGNQIWNCSHSGKNTEWDHSGKDGLSSFCKWDGVTVKGGWDMNGDSGDFVQQDVYVWKVALTDIFDKRHTYIGNVNVLK